MVGGVQKVEESFRVYDGGFCRGRVEYMYICMLYGVYILTTINPNDKRRRYPRKQKVNKNVGGYQINAMLALLNDS